MTKLFTDDAITADGKIYFVAKDMPVLYSMEAETGVITCAGILPGENIAQKQTTRKIVRWKDRLVIVPYNASRIYIYDLGTKEISAVDYPNGRARGYMYAEAFAYEDKIIMIGAFAANIIELDMNTLGVSVRNTCFEEYEEPKDMFCRSGYAVKDGTLYIAMAVSGSVLKIDLKTWEYSLVAPGDKDFRYSGIAYDGGNFWLTARRGSGVYIWDGDKKFESFDLPFELPDKWCNLGGVYFYDNSIWLHGFEGEGRTVKIDPKSRSIKEQDERRYFFFRNVGDECIIGQERSGIIRIIRGEDVKEYDPDIPEDELMKIKMSFDPSAVFGDGRIMTENEVFGIGELVEMLKKPGDAQ